MKKSSFSQKEKAQSLTELAISFTFLMLLLAGSVDLGRIFFTMIQLQDAAQEGAIYGSSDPTNSTEIEDRVRAIASNPIDLTDTVLVHVDVDTVPPGSDLCAGTALKVDVTYTYTFTMPFISMAIPSNTVPLTGSATSTILTPPCP
jgi:Flp pilus assembly protein TadG